MLDDKCCRCFCQTTTAEVGPTAGACDDEVSLLRQQTELFKEDFENERRDHQRTKAQVQSLTIQWRTLHDELRRCQAKVRFEIDLLYLCKKKCCKKSI